MKRYDIATYFEDKPRVVIEEHFDGDYCKYLDVEKLEALNKAFEITNKGLSDSLEMYKTENDRCDKEITRLQALTKEFAEGIMDNIITYDNEWERCNGCYEIGYSVKHKESCIATKAQQYLDSLTN